MKKLLKLFGVGLLGGMGTRCGCMLADALFPNGLGGFFRKFNEPPKEEPVKRKPKTDASPNRSLVYLYEGKGR